MWVPRDEEDIFEESRIAYNEKNAGYARLLCEEILERFPELWPSLLRYAASLFHLGQFDRALSAKYTLSQ